MRIASWGQPAFAAVMIALGMQGLITGRFTAVWQPVPADVPARQALVYLCALVSLGSGIGLLVTRGAALAARVLLALLVLWLLVFRLRDILRGPTGFDAWDGAAETAAMVCAALVLATGPRGARIARVLFGLALISFGAAHFVYLQPTASLVPRWVPSHSVVAAVTGAAFLAAAAGILTGICARWAATLVTLQIGLFTLLVWVPIVTVRGSKTAFQWSEFAISCALTAAAWVVADSYPPARQPREADHARP
jgi:uncharacterized membrane protein